MDVQALRPLVPRALEIDLFAGQAYVSLLPFRIAASRPSGMPRALASSLLETNLRTYVRAADGGSGIFFFSLDASSFLAVAGARLLYGLPYFLADMAMRVEGPRVEYAARRRRPRGAQLEVTWAIGEPTGTALAGTRDHFLVERYELYVARFGRIYRGRVRHRPYPLCRVAVERLSETLLGAARLPTPTVMPLAHYSPGVDVDISWLERVPPG